MKQIPKINFKNSRIKEKYQNNFTKSPTDLKT